MSTRSMARKALMSVDTENKYLDFFATATNIINTGTVVLLNGIDEGSDPTQRIGRSIRMKSLLLRTRTITSDNAAVIAQVMRYMVVLDKQPNGVLANADEILNDISDNLAVPLTPLLPANFKRFRVIRDFNVVMNKEGRNLVVTKHFIRMNIKPRYGTGGATITDIATGALLLVVLSDDSVATNAPVSSVYTRLRFVG